MAEAVEVLRRGTAVAVAISCAGVVSAGLLDASSSSRVRALVDRGLHLLQEVVDVEEIRLGSQVRHWREGVLVLGHGRTAASVAVDRHHRRARWHVVRHAACLDRHALQEGQAAADFSVGCRVDLPALGITKEVIQGVIALSIIITPVLAKVGSVVDGIVHWAIRAGLLRLVVAGGRVVVGILVATWCTAVVHVAGGVVVTCGGRCKVLQVSNH